MLVFVALVLSASVASLCRNVTVGAASEIHVGPGQSIQEAINNAANGDTIVVQNGIHSEGQYPIVVNKSITLTGQNVAETVINGMDSDTGVLLVKADDVRVLNLTIQNVTNFATGVSLADVRFAEVDNCIVADCGNGLLLTNSSNSSITRNNIENNKSCGLALHDASSFNAILDNNFTYNPTGITILDPSCQENVIYHNNFVANTNQESNLGTSTGWDDGYPSGGNFWDNHENEDLLSGVGQNLTGSDGIADTSYRDLDRYPLAEPVRVFYMDEWNQIGYYALISSNSTVSGFEFDPAAGSFLTFKASGSDGTVGCCRVILSKSVLWAESVGSWAVTVNGTAPATSPLILEDADSTYFFLAYSQSAEVIRIAGTHVVPEYSWLALLLLLVFSGSGLILHNKRDRAKLILEAS